MIRRKFFRDVSFAVIASLLPKILQPAMPEVVDEPAGHAMHFDIADFYKVEQINVYTVFVTNEGIEFIGPETIQINL